MFKHLALLVYSGELFVGGWQQVQEPTPRANRAQSSGLAVHDDLVRASGWAMIAGAVALHIPRLQRLAAVALAVQLLPITWIGHRFWEADEAQYAQQKTHFFKNLSMIGAALYIAATAR